MGVFDQDSVNSSLSHAEAYIYDNLNRLTNAVATGNSTYDLPFSYTADGSDGRYGNVTCVINGSTSGLCPTYNFSPTNNRITNSGYTYDAAGNLTSDGTSSYQYDAEGRLRSAGLGGSTVSVVYNALGQTVERSSTGGVAYRQENLYDPEGRELANYDGADGVWWGRNIALGNRNVALYFSNYVRFVHANNVGTTTAVTDQTGSLLQDQLYYPWGQQWTTAGSAQDLHFASLEQLEPDLGMYPTPHRRYTPTLGRWLTPDPGNAGADPSNPQTWNMYAYVGNNPTSRSDPSGLCIEDACVVETAIGLGVYSLTVATEEYLRSPAGKQATQDLGNLLIHAGREVEGDIQAGISLAKQGMESSGPKADNAVGVTAGGQATDEYGRKLGPSGKPVVHEVEHPTVKGAKDAARAEGKSAPVKHASPTRGKPHFHPTDEIGKKLPCSTHHNCPE